jgi:ketosteroid isomerase-like protein
MTDDGAILGLADRFVAALNAHDLEGALELITDDFVFESTTPAPDGARYEGKDAVRAIWAEMLEATPKLRFTTEEQFVVPPDRAVVLWRYDWGDGHVRGVDVLRARDGKFCESASYVKG